ncbi:MAG TPA: FAD-containing oxidoreductase [Roseiarcus sp.]|jgi:pyruvate/2-oxoglutarate dehydrogenase complex dihydrolipoamide dehydrogenase (E3) component|nr:FAD-containing oxidoreductase [Roseiarcus sp.]
MNRRFDDVVIGAGQAGPPMAGRLAAAGRTVALVERKLIGGTCVNTGCTPTKTLVASAYAAHLARRAADFGLSAGPVSVDFAAVKTRMDGVVGNSRSHLEAWLGDMANCTVLRGHARFSSPTTVEVGGETLEADRFFINVGGRAIVPDFPGLDQIRTLTNTSLLQLDVLPRHLVVVGGSYVGLEFAQMFRRFGAAITVVEKAPRLCSREDEEVSDAVREILAAEGVAIRCDAKCIRFARRGADVAVGVECASGEPEVVGSHVLLAVGRRPNTDDLRLDAAGVALDERGYIRVDNGLRTSVPHIFALGDCNGRGAFTHTSYNDFEIAAANLLDGKARKASDRIPAYALYIDPPLGRVGLTEAEARARGHNVRIGRRPMTRVSRAVEKGETQGFMKVVVDRDSDAILGAAILGVGGDEAIHGVIEAMAAGVTAKAYTRAMAIHPTVSELVPTIFGELSA